MFHFDKCRCQKYIFISYIIYFLLFDSHSGHYFHSSALIARHSVTLSSATQNTMSWKLSSRKQSFLELGFSAYLAIYGMQCKICIYNYLNPFQISRSSKKRTFTAMFPKKTYMREKSDLVNNMKIYKIYCVNIFRPVRHSILNEVKIRY